MKIFRVNLPHVLILGLLLHTGVQAIPVEASNPVAGFLRRLEEKGIIDPGFLSTLPLQEYEVEKALSSAYKHSDQLGAWDRRQLKTYLDIFDPVRKRHGTKIQYRDSSFTVYGNVSFYTGIFVRDSIPRADTYAFGTLSPGLEASYRNWIDLTTTATVGREQSLHPRHRGENFLPQNGLPFNIERMDGQPVGKVSTFDGFRMMIGFGREDLRLEGGQDWNQWGPGQWQHTTLGQYPYCWVSDSIAASPGPGFEGTQTPGSYRRGYRYPGEGPPLPQIRLTFKSDRWEYTKIVAQRTGLWKDSSAMLMAHRLQLRAGDFKFGLTEMLTIGSRNPGLLALLPAVPLKVIEHEGGNRDNTAMSGDVEWIWPGYGRIYGEFFLDDFSAPPLDYWGNKFAWTVGVSLQDPFSLPSEIHVEYSRVDPWVYGHNLPGNQMQSYGALLGSSLPPNSQAVNASVAFPLPFGATGALEWNFRQRDLKSRGSSIFDNYFDDDFNPPPKETIKQFLVRDVETRHTLTAAADWRWNRFLELKCEAGWLHVQNWRGEPGVTLSAPSASSEIWLHY